MTRPIKYVSCGRHVEPKGDGRLLMEAVGYALLALVSGYLVFQIIWLLFAVGP